MSSRQAWAVPAMFTVPSASSSMDGTTTASRFFHCSAFPLRLNWIGQAARGESSWTGFRNAISERSSAAMTTALPTAIFCNSRPAIVPAQSTAISRSGSDQTDPDGSVNSQLVMPASMCPAQSSPSWLSQFAVKRASPASFRAFEINYFREFTVQVIEA